MFLSEINIYPIKSLKGNTLSESVVEKRGLRHDRRWMLTDPEGMFLTQREVPRMALLSVEVEAERLVADFPGAEPIQIQIGASKDNVKPQTVRVWDSDCEALVYPADVNQWFSEVLDTTCQLVVMPETTHRHVQKRFDTGEDIVSFADGYPLLVLGEASVADLNERLVATYQDEAAAVPTNRFRPNLVVRGSGPFAEDGWKRIKVGEAVFRGVKRCARCVITTIDQARGEFDGKEPLRTLSMFRLAHQVCPDTYEAFGHSPNAVLFGQNLIPENPGAIVRVGDTIEVLE